MKNQRNRFAVAFFAALVLSMLSMTWIAPAGAQTAPGKVGGLSVAISAVSGTDASAILTWDEPTTNPALRSNVQYVVHLVEGAQAAQPVFTRNNVAPPAGATDNSSPAGITNTLITDGCTRGNLIHVIEPFSVFVNTPGYSCRPNRALGFTGFGHGKTYKVRVRGYQVNAGFHAGFGTISDPLVFTIPDHVAMAPGDPTINAASGVGGLG